MATLSDVAAEVRKVESGGMPEDVRCKCTSLFGRLPLARARPICELVLVVGHRAQYGSKSYEKDSVGYEPIHIS